MKIAAPFFTHRIIRGRTIIYHAVSHEDRGAVRAFLTEASRISEHEISVTFDDGFYSSYEIIKKMRNIRTVFFVCPSFIDCRDSARWKHFIQNNLLEFQYSNSDDIPLWMRPVQWPELRELASLGHAIGSHSMTHKNLARITSQKELEYEIISSGDTIEDRIGCKVDSFAYPFGNLDCISDRALRIILKRYQYCFTGIRGNNKASTASRIIWRDAINPSLPNEYSILLLRGVFDWYYRWNRVRMSTMFERALRSTV